MFVGHYNTYRLGLVKLTVALNRSDELAPALRLAQSYVKLVVYAVPLTGSRSIRLLTVPSALYA